MYSADAILQLANAVMYHALLFILRRWAYQTNVIKMLESTSRKPVFSTTAIYENSLRCFH
jgi:hypothetical protein